MVAVVHMNISVCSRVGIRATGACMGHPVCGYHGFFPVDDSDCLVCI